MCERVSGGSIAGEPREEFMSEIPVCHIWYGFCLPPTFSTFDESIKVIPEICIAHPYCARFLRHQRVHMSVPLPNIRDFPQSKLDGEINAPFLLIK